MVRILRDFIQTFLGNRSFSFVGGEGVLDSTPAAAGVWLDDKLWVDAQQWIDQGD